MADEWFSTLDPETQAHITGKGWEKLDPVAAAAEAAKAHYAAQKLIGHPADQVLKLPKDANDPTYKDVYDRVVGMSTPKDPSEYVFDGVKTKGGADLSPEDAAFVRNLATEFKLPTTVAKGLAERLVARADAAGDASAAGVETTKAANHAHLRAAWGAEYDMKSFSATRAAEAAGLPTSVLAYIATLPAAEYQKGMDAFVDLGKKMGEAAMLRGGGAPQADPTAGLNAGEAQARLDGFKADKIWQAKFFAGDTATVAEWTKLCTIVAASRVPRQ